MSAEPVVIVTGSIATDHLMRFPGRFADQFLADRLATVSLSFLVDDLIIRHGGVAANVAYGISRLGLTPLLVGAAGPDFGPYRMRLEGHGVDCSAVLISETRQTARFVCTTDQDLCQIASFYAGAMAEAADIDLTTIADRTGRPDLVVIAPDVPAAMNRHADACRRMGVPFAADPSQQLARMGAADLSRFIAGASYLFTNEYEFDLLKRRLAIADEEVTGMVDTVVTTRGSAGARIVSAGAVTEVPAVPVGGVTDPTGAGDAFQAGFLTGVLRGLPDVSAVAVGCQMAGYALRAVGTQEYDVGVPALCDDLSAAYGMALSTEVRTALTPATHRAAR